MMKEIKSFLGYRNQIVVGVDGLSFPEAVREAFEKGKHLTSTNVVEFIQHARYEASKPFTVEIITPSEVGITKETTIGKVIRKARDKYGLQLLTDQDVFRLRCVLHESPGKMFYAATMPVYYKGAQHMYLLERFVVDGTSSLSDITGSMDTKIFPGSKIIFKSSK
jgi:hypothetical protein